MSARLKALELIGYKTFANRTVFEFAERVTAIVGPNGSGKSNIADSLRWVLGEQSYSLLRGKRTEDMIFSGSEQRPRAGMAAATVTFDNSDGWLPIDFSYRQVQASGQSLWRLQPRCFWNIRFHVFLPELRGRQPPGSSLYQVYQVTSDPSVPKCVIETEIVLTYFN